MPFGTWWRGDYLPDLSSLPTFSAHLSTDTLLISRLTNLSQEVISARFQTGNHCYIGFLDETPVAFGWVATQKGYISGFQFSFVVPPQNCYLWDFLTLPEWRGRGIYPRLLQTIIRHNYLIDRFWIGYEPGNESSASGINKAGFHIVSDFVITGGHISGLVLFDGSDYARASADLFNLPVR